IFIARAKQSLNVRSDSNTLLHSEAGAFLLRGPDSRTGTLPVRPTKSRQLPELAHPRQAVDTSALIRRRTRLPLWSKKIVPRGDGTSRNARSWSASNYHWD